MSDFNTALNQHPIGLHYLAALTKQFPAAILGSEWQTDTQATVTIKLNALPEVVEWLYYQQGGWLSVLFGNDERSLCGNYALYYVLSMEQGVKCWITVRAEVDPVSLEFSSVTPRVPAAVWGEREVRDMYGLRPVGLPDERRLVLPDDWPDDLYPLRKDSMDYRQRPPRRRMKKPTRLFLKPKKAAKLCPLVRCTLPLTSPDTFACSLMAKTLSMPITGCFTSIAAWKNWLKPAWVTTRSPSFLTACAAYVALPTAWRTPPRLKMQWGLWCQNGHR